MVKSIGKTLLLAGLLGAFWFSSNQVAKAVGSPCQLVGTRCVAVNCIQCAKSGSKCVCVQ